MLNILGLGKNEDYHSSLRVSLLQRLHLNQHTFNPVKMVAPT